MRAYMAPDIERQLLALFGIDPERLQRLAFFLLGHAALDRWLIHLLAVDRFREMVAANPQEPPADPDRALYRLLKACSRGTFDVHLRAARDRRLIGSEHLDICSDVNSARNRVLHWKPARSTPPQYRGSDVTTQEGLDRCLVDVATAVQAIRDWRTS